MKDSQNSVQTLTLSIPVGRAHICPCPNPRTQQGLALRADWSAPGDRTAAHHHQQLSAAADRCWAGSEDASSPGFSFLIYTNGTGETEGAYCRDAKNRTDMQLLYKQQSREDEQGWLGTRPPCPAAGARGHLGAETFQGEHPVEQVALTGPPRSQLLPG